jgi:signal transduction histidine kinase
VEGSAVQTRLTADELTALVEVGKLVNAELDLDAVLRTVMNAATELMRAEASALVLVDRETGELVFHTARGDKAGEVGSVRLKPGEGIVGAVIESGEPHIANDVANDPMFFEGVDNSTGFTTKSVLCVPLITEDRRWGAIEVLNKEDDQPFDEHDLLLCEVFADQAAAAIGMAFLHEQKVESERMAAIGETVAGLAHCVKNVLNGIQGGTYLVDRGLKNEDLPSVGHGWEMVKKYNGFMKSLTLDMLTYAKEREPEYDRVDVNAIIESVCEMCSSEAQESGVDVAWEGGASLDDVVIDPTGIRRCLLNLVSNAVDACRSENGGRVRVTSQLGDADTFRVLISDNGCGISESDKRKLFRTFFSTKGSRGTGLGLAVTQKIIEEHNGRIEVDSTVGRGTTFTVTLPLEQLQAQRSREDAARKTERTQKGRHP